MTSSSSSCFWLVRYGGEEKSCTCRAGAVNLLLALLPADASDLVRAKLRQYDARKIKHFSTVLRRDGGIDSEVGLRSGVRLRRKQDGGGNEEFIEVTCGGYTSPQQRYTIVLRNSATAESTLMHNHDAAAIRTAILTQLMSKEASMLASSSSSSS
jgi:hypothetical protein